ncbi:protease inhibitor I42 family protein [Clostridium sp. FP1]|uniref:protease inhibitor I42 family protein n=1 Tax=Clostridium sp. FP1 TaxID=2724076 RepID=UPI0013E95A03|nr:protease inhibitor I42 family protein [Clostridium sp. FP1]MBZ9637434.1 protease inhibitor I42 family protein [Clostridium sp. FP1]
MKKFMKKILPLVFIVVLLFIYILYYNSKTVIYMGKSNSILKNHKYNSQLVYIIRFQTPFTEFGQYQLNKNENVDLIIPKDTEFIVSLSSSISRPYKWRIAQVKDNKILEYKGDNFIEPYDFKFTSLKGNSNRRQNISFKAKAIGNEKIVLKYMNIDSSEVESELILNIGVK